MSETKHFVITSAHHGPLPGLPWCIAFEAEDGTRIPVAWLRSRGEAERLRRVFADPNVSPDMTHADTQALPPSSTSRHGTAKTSPPMSLLEWMAVVSAFLVAAGVMALVERFITRPVR